MLNKPLKCYHAEAIELAILAADAVGNSYGDLVEADSGVAGDDVVGKVVHHIVAFLRTEAFVVKIGKCFGNADKHHVEYIAFGHSTSLLAPGLLKILHLKNKCLHSEEIS